MQNKDKTRFTGLMAMLAEAFDKDNTKLRMDVYFGGLKDFEIKEVEASIYQAVKSLKFFPKVAELRQLIEGDADSRALLGWRIAVDSRNYYYGADFSEDPAIAYCIEELCDTYVSFCEKTLEELKWLEKRFLDLYRLALKRPSLLADRSPVLDGLFQIDNRKKGLLTAVPPVPKITARKRVEEIEAPKPKEIEQKT